MIGYLKKVLSLLRIKNKSTESEDEPKETKLSHKLSRNLESLKGIFGESGDVVFREFTFGKEYEIKAALLFVDGLVNSAVINENILKPILFDSHFLHAGETLEPSDMDELKLCLLSAGEVKDADTIEAAVEAVLTGDTALFVDGFNIALTIGSKGFEKRSITEPQTEAVVRGPREGFNENIRTTTALLRRKIKNPALKIEHVKSGKRTNTPVCIAYIDNLANPDLVKEVKKRVENIDIDAILASGYIESFIEDAPYSVFQTIGYTEKPDVVAGRLLEGRVAVLVDGTPFVLTMPMLFIECFQTSEDYYIRSPYASFLRFMRFIAYLICLTTPALYVALTTYQQEMIPTPLLFTMAASSEGVPFPAAVEAAIMLIAFEVLKEAGVRLPKPIGSAISIVGALVMGQAAVQAGIVGAPVVIVIAFTAVASFVNPMLYDSAALLRWFLLILAATMGGFGITIGMIMILVHLTSLKSFGTAYLSPIAPFYSPDLKDTFVRAPLWFMKTRPRAIRPQDITRR